MGFTLYGQKGKELDINVGTRDLLTQLTAGWWPLLGLPARINKEDCIMLGRVLNNYAFLQEHMDPIFRKLMRWPEETADDIDWLRGAANFFRRYGPVERRGV